MVIIYYYWADFLDLNHFQSFRAIDFSLPHRKTTKISLWAPRRARIVRICFQKAALVRNSMDDANWCYIDVGMSENTQCNYPKTQWLIRIFPIKMAITGGSIIFRDTHVIEILLMICWIAKLSETGDMCFKHGGPRNIQRAPCDCSCCMGQNFGNPISSPVEVHSEDTAKNVRHILKQNLRQGPSLHKFQEVMVWLVQLVEVILGAYSGGDPTYVHRPMYCRCQKEYSLPQHATTIYCCCGFPLPISLDLPGSPHSDPESGPGSRWAELDEGKQCSPPQLRKAKPALWSKSPCLMGGIPHSYGKSPCLMGKSTINDLNHHV